MKHIWVLSDETTGYMVAFVDKEAAIRWAFEVDEGRQFANVIKWQNVDEAFGTFTQDHEGNTSPEEVGYLIRVEVR